MIKQSSIDNLRTAIFIDDVIEDFVSLKKSGATSVGNCPFHDEKTPSFRVFHNTQTYKCFGCGKGGDVFKFVMEIKHLPFYEAIEFLADKFSIPLERENEKEISKEAKDNIQEQYKILEWAANKYEKNIEDSGTEAYKFLSSKGYDIERIKKWGIGVAPEDWKFITSTIINRGKYENGFATGLINTKNGNSFDVLRNRITIPLHDVNGRIIGISGRRYLMEDEKQVKYINPKETDLFKKDRFWYGLWYAQKAIKLEEFAYIVEGYTDVHAMHDIGNMPNTIAACGTALTPSQVKLLKKYTSSVVLVYDNDNAGQNAALKNIDLFLEHNFKVQIVELPEKEDPESFLLKNKLETVC